MSENFGFIDIILLAMIAGFIFLRLRNILGKGVDNSPIKPNFAKFGLMGELSTPFPRMFRKRKKMKPAIIASKIMSIKPKFSLIFEYLILMLIYKSSICK